MIVGKHFYKQKLNSLPVKLLNQILKKGLQLGIRFCTHIARRSLHLPENVEQNTHKIFLQRRDQQWHITCGKFPRHL